MQYRMLGNTGLNVSTISMGCEGFLAKSAVEMMNDVQYLMERGINFIDMYSPNPEFRENFGKAIAGRRDKIILQSHVCAVFQNGQYLRTRNIEQVKAGFELQLQQLQTDYLDVGMIHYVDSMEDWKKIHQGPVVAYVRQLKREGRIHHIGLSSHNPEVAMAAAKSGAIEVLLFSINPCYDMQPPNEDVEKLWAGESYRHQLHNQDEQRKALYELCESKGIGIDVMKAYGGGDLLSAALSPFGRAFTPVQCIHYGLTRPAVASVMLGCKTKAEWDAALAYDDATAQEKDYSGVLAGLEKFTFDGHCMYCGHCAPCAVGIDVAAVTKFLNLAIAQGMVPETVREHYEVLPHHASECIGCGMCEMNCPFGVKIMDNMKKTTGIFGK